jgi:tetratricopeptide (TPR) repeat protein
MYLLNKVHTFLAKNFAFTGYKTFVLQSIVSGGLYVFFACLISNLTGRILLEKVITFLFFISIGAILLFFGYIEIYSVPALSIIIYVYFSLLWVKGKTNFILPFLALILAVALHLMAIGLVPSFFIVLYQKYGKRIPFLKNIKTKPFIILILFLLPVAFKLAAVLHLGDLMPVSESIKAPKVMLLFSSRHLWEFLNSQILASGLYFILLVYFTIKAIRGRLKFDDIMWFYGSASFFMLFIAFVTNKMRGSGDWDICALPAIIVSPMVAYMWFSNVQATGQYKKFKYALVVILVMNFVNSIAWIGINASDKSIKKIESMLENDPGYYYVTKLPSLYNLALSYRANGLKEESLNCYKKIYRKYYNSPEAHINYANQLIEYGKDQEGAAILINLIRMNPYISVAYPMLFKIYEKYKMQDNIYATVNQLFINYQTNPRICLLNFNKKDLGNYFYYLYRVELQRKDVEKAKIIAGVINQIQAK